MSETYITHALPEGVGQPLFSRLLARDESGKLVVRGWIRAGDVRRIGDEVHFEPRWDGRAFVALFDKARRDQPLQDGPRVDFAVRRSGRLVLIGQANLSWDNVRAASREVRKARDERRRFLYGRG